MGKLFKASKNNKHAEIYPLSDSPNDVVFEQIQEDYNSLKAKIPSDFWAELKHQGLIEPSASLVACLAPVAIMLRAELRRSAHMLPLSAESGHLKSCCSSQRPSRTQWRRPRVA